MHNSGLIILHDIFYIEKPAFNSFYNIQALNVLIAAPWPTLMFHFV